MSLCTPTPHLCFIEQCIKYEGIYHIEGYFVGRNFHEKLKVLRINSHVFELPLCKPCWYFVPRRTGLGMMLEFVLYNIEPVCQTTKY